MIKTLVAVPVYNEQQYVQKVLSHISQFAEEILVVDDGSTDQTPCLLAKLEVDVIRHKTNRGYGRSIRDAFRWSECYGYDWLITMDCDDQHEPEALPRFYEAIQRDDADIISGSRYLDPEVSGDPPPEDRREINGKITELVNQRLGLSITDAFCGFKAYRVSQLKNLPHTEDGYAIPMQTWTQAAAHDLRVTEVPVRLIYNDPNRTFGGHLDDPSLRLQHYLQALNHEMAKFPEKFGPVGCACGSH